MAITTAAAIFGSAILGAGVSAWAANESQDEISDAARDNNREARYQFDRAVELNEPWRQSGMGALAQQNALLGIGPSNDNYGFGGGGGGGAPASVNPATGQGYSGTNWGGYFGANQDVQDYWNNNPQAQSTFGNPEAFAEYHYNTFGQGEGRNLPQYGQGPENANALAGFPGASGASDIPGVVGYTGDGGFRQGGEQGNALVELSPPPTQSPGDAAYAQFENGGFARSMLQTTQSDMNMITGQMGAAGTAVSGSHIGALNDRNRRNTNAAFTQHYNALAGMSGTGANITAQQGQQGMDLARTIGQNSTNAARGSASSYGAIAGAANSALQNGANTYAYGRANGWFNNSSSPPGGWEPQAGFDTGWGG